MAWNRSNVESAKREVRSAKQMPRAWLTLLIAGVAVALGAGVWWFFSADDASRVTRPSEGREKRIKEVKPAAPKRAENPLPQEKAEKPKKKDNTYIDEHGVERYKVGNARVPKPVDPKNVVPCGTPRSGPNFKHYAEQELAALLTIEPGEVRHGVVEYDAAFMKDFQESLFDKIEYEEGDTEEDKRIKDDVAALKKELAERIRKGEDLKTILETERDEMTRLSTYKQSLESLFEEARQKDGFTVQDAKDFYAAANEMLKKEGIKPMEISGLTLRRLQRQMEQHQGQEPQQQESEQENKE